MKKNILLVCACAVVAGLTSFGVTKAAVAANTGAQQTPSGSSESFRTVNLNLEDYPDFTFAAESCVDAVVYVKVTVTDKVAAAPNSIFDFFSRHLYHFRLCI